MRKVFHFDSPREKYHCDASVVGCFDNRFETACRKLLKRIGVGAAVAWTALTVVLSPGGGACCAKPIASLVG